MEFLTGFLTSLFAHNLLLMGKGVNAIVSLSVDNKKSHKYVIIYYFLSALILGFVAYGLNFAEQVLSEIKYFYILILVGALVLISILFYVITIPIKKAHQALKDECVAIILSTATFAVGLAVLTLVQEQASLLLILANIIGLPLGYVFSILVFRPITERITISNAPKGFKGGPLILITSCIIVLAFSALSF